MELEHSFATDGGADVPDHPQLATPAQYVAGRASRTGNLSARDVVDEVPAPDLLPRGRTRLVKESTTDPIMNAQAPDSIVRVGAIVRTCWDA
ncbi:hypothetical protein ACIA03_23445 [Nocardioides sp. NPDC051685]|uniref:hypothetical protein n=1 Tax=Nocardioides sp. NPDC051685 TaxID=3364334 RepID=UPI0037A0AEFD